MTSSKEWILLMTRLSKLVQDAYIARHGFTLSAEERIADLEAKLACAENTADRLRSLLARQIYLGQRDVLTGLLNRRAYEEQINIQFTRWQRHNDGLVMLVADIDSFKKINDCYGHLVGDKVLKKVAKLLKKSFRVYDLVARVGGEEFIIVLDKISLADAKKVAEKARAAVQQATFQNSTCFIPITLSIGVAEFKKGDKPADVFARADKALFKAKRQGRNRVRS